MCITIPRHSELVLPVPWHIVKSGFHCGRDLQHVIFIHFSRVPLVKKPMCPSWESWLYVVLYCIPRVWSDVQLFSPSYRQWRELFVTLWQARTVWPHQSPLMHFWNDLLQARGDVLGAKELKYPSYLKFAVDTSNMLYKYRQKVLSSFTGVTITSGDRRESFS